MFIQSRNPLLERFNLDSNDRFINLKNVNGHATEKNKVTRSNQSKVVRCTNKSSSLNKACTENNNSNSFTGDQGKTLNYY